MRNSQSLSSQTSNSSLLNLFRYAKNSDRWLIFGGAMFAILQGIGIPLFSLLWGSLVDTLATGDNPKDAAKTIMLELIYLGIGVFLTGWGSYTCWMITGTRQSIECRKIYIKRLLRQEIAWFDTHNQQEISIKFSADCLTYQKAIGENFFNIILALSMMIAGIVIAFIHGWLMTLVILGAVPIIVFGYYLYGNIITAKNKKQEEIFGEVGGKMQEIISSIQTVKMLNGEEFQTQRFKNILEKAKEKMNAFLIKLIFIAGLSFMFLNLAFTLGFWFGSKCVTGEPGCMTSEEQGNRYTAGNALLIFFSILIPAVSFNQVIISFQKIAEGKAAAARIFDIIDRKPQIQSSPNAIVPDHFGGVFNFEQVTFSYPKEKDKTVLNKLSMRIDLKNTALAGHSGCGKSTVFQLMMRFYDPDSGRVTLDGTDLRELNVEWLRRQIGYVGQEPVLFGMTIRENLLLGNPDATEQEMIKALKEAEAYDFVQEFSLKLDENVGQCGSLISGGQKQRLAIARALVKKPQLLLLDEATSSLDRRNEALIQETLSKISQHIRSITIAHRQNTIMGCDRIYYLNEGIIEAEGRYEQLKAHEAKYFQQSQQTKKVERKLSKKVSIAAYEFLVDENPQLNNQNIGDATEAVINNPQQLPTNNLNIWDRLSEYLREYRWIIIIGCIMSIANGIIFPLFGIVLAKILVIELEFNPFMPGSSFDSIKIYSIYSLIASLAGYFLVAIEKSIFNKIALEISSQLRLKSVTKIIKMPIPYFDCQDNSLGSLSVAIDADCNTINKFISSILSTIIWLFSGIVFGVIFSFIFQWRTSLVSLGFLPLIGLSGLIQLSFSSGLKLKVEQSFRASVSILTEAVKSIRTIVSLNAEVSIQNKYEQNLKNSSPDIIQQSILSGIFFGLSYMIMYVVIGLIVYLAIVFKTDNNLATDDIFCSIFLITFSGLTVGTSLIYFPDINGAKKSMKRIFKLLEEKEEDQINSLTITGKTIHEPIRGAIKFSNVNFKYEREEELNLKNLNFQIKPGQKVGIVGHSGCGKSTIIKLLQGFYKPISGSIAIDNRKLEDFDIHHLRECIGVVNQEPTLFNGTIERNILYNKAGSKEDIHKIMNQVEFAPLQLSNAESEGDWLDKNVGIKGSHISGGQKQRVAILRALYRNPNFYLFDEATSALDNKNEEMVMQSLQKICRNKTVINVTHKPHTLEAYHLILVMKKGELVQYGTYNQLAKKRGQFYELLKGKQQGQEPEYQFGTI